MKTVLCCLFAVSLAAHALAGPQDDPSSVLTIESARYGTDENRVDVAPILRSLIAHNCLYLRAKWGLGDRDPAPGVPKDVEIVFSCNGAHQVAVFRQDQDIVLLSGSDRFVILSASFGAGDRRVDVTEDVRAAVKDGVLHRGTPWGFGHVDPAFGVVKNVQIVYVELGALKTATFNQHEEINLPASE